MIRTVKINTDSYFRALQTTCSTISSMKIHYVRRRMGVIVGILNAFGFNIGSRPIVDASVSSCHKNVIMAKKTMNDTLFVMRYFSKPPCPARGRGNDCVAGADIGRTLFCRLALSGYSTSSRLALTNRPAQIRSAVLFG